MCEPIQVRLFSAGLNEYAASVNMENGEMRLRTRKSPVTTWRKMLPEEVQAWLIRRVENLLATS